MPPGPWRCSPPRPACSVASWPSTRPTAWCWPEGGEIETISGIQVCTRSLEQVAREVPDIDTLIVIGGPGVSRLETDADAIAWLRRHAPSARRLCSVGTGASPWPPPACWTDAAW